MQRFFLVCLLCSLFLCGSAQDLAFAFSGGGPVHQTRTIGGKNPMKQRSIRRANPVTRIFHNSSCKYFKSKQSTIHFKSAQEALLSGFRPCPQCGG